MITWASTNAGVKKCYIYLTQILGYLWWHVNTSQHAHTESRKRMYITAARAAMHTSSYVCIV